MRKALLVAVVLFLLIMVGCSVERYQVFTLHEGSEFRSEQESHGSGSDEAGAGHEKHLEVKRKVLVDTKTGKVYYFLENGGELRSK